MARGTVSYGAGMCTCNPNWLPANLGSTPIWFQSKLRLAFIFRGANMEKTKKPPQPEIVLCRREGEAMKKALLPPALILFLAVCPAWTKKIPPRPFQLREDVTLNGADIPAGTYELTWEIHGSAARVTLRKHGQFVATAPAVWAKNGVKYQEDEALLRVNSDGSKSLIEIRIAGSPRAIVFANSDTPVHYTAMKP
jgi:hypothetical protein